MASNPQERVEESQAIDPRIDDARREGLTGTTPASAYGPTRDPDEITVAPDGLPREAQPGWRQDFPVDWSQDQYVARRDFAKFLVLTSGAFVAGQGWIAAKHLIRARRVLPQRVQIAALRDVPVGTARMFAYPSEHDPCLLLRLDENTLAAFSQACTHLSCAVIPDFEQGVLHCPCHEGFFDLRTGQNIAGPPPRPLPKILIELADGNVYAVGVEERTT